jgi:hypothetical protein
MYHFDVNNDQAGRRVGGSTSWVKKTPSKFGDGTPKEPAGELVLPKV